MITNSDSRPTEQGETRKQEPWKFNVDPNCARCDHALREHRGHLMADPCSVAGCRCEFACYQPLREKSK